MIFISALQLSNQLFHCAHLTETADYICMDAHLWAACGMNYLKLAKSCQNPQLPQRTTCQNLRLPQRTTCQNLPLPQRTTCQNRLPQRTSKNVIWAKAAVLIIPAPAKIMRLKVIWPHSWHRLCSYAFAMAKIEYTRLFL